MSQNKFLLAAEADRIQNSIFKSTRLAEIIGGSQKLTDFCCRMKKDMIDDKISEEDIVIADGGAFRVVFSDQAKCEAWGEKLAERYALEVGGTISVTEPRIIPDGKFADASRLAQDDLRREKNSPKSFSSCLHNPFVAYCDVCGSGLGYTRVYTKETASNRNTVCAVCADKINFVRDLNKQAQPEQAEDLLGKFRCEVEKLISGRTVNFERESEKIAAHDSRANVAYLLADGNDMGILFNKCEQEQMRQLSQGLSDVIIEALAEATVQMIKALGVDNQDVINSPVIPLIIGGDDIYLMLATPYCLDFARKFCVQYVQKLKKLIADFSLQTEGEERQPENNDPSICIGLVVCKAKYPHALAYDEAHEYLQQAKTAAKEERRKSISCMSFGEAPGKTGNTCTLKPYDLSEQHSSQHLPPLALLFSERKRLERVPRTRLESLHAFFDRVMAMNVYETEQWNKEFQVFLNRVARKDSAKPEEVKIRKDLEKSLEVLGSGEADKQYLRDVYSLSSDNDYGSGIPDLLEFWEYCLEMGANEEDSK